MSTRIFKGWSLRIPDAEDIEKGILHFRTLVPPSFVERNTIERDAIEELAENIKRVGLINPLMVKKVKDKYEIVAGHRRYLALKLLGAISVQCNIVTGTVAETEFIKLSENLMREDLNDVEEAQMLMRLKKISQGTEKSVAKQIGKSEGYVRQKLTILKYPERLFKALADKKITFSVARELMRLKNENLLFEYLKHAVEGGATPALVKSWVDDIIFQEKREGLIAKGHTVESIDVQQTKHFYECHLCKEAASLVDSGLFRIHYACEKELFK